MQNSNGPLSAFQFCLDLFQCLRLMKFKGIHKSEMKQKWKRNSPETDLKLVWEKETAASQSTRFFYRFISFQICFSISDLPRICFCFLSFISVSFQLYACLNEQLTSLLLKSPGATQPLLQHVTDLFVQALVSSPSSIDRFTPIRLGSSGYL